MTSMKIKWAGTPNFTKGRNNRKIEAIVDHITAGNYPGCLNWMQNPQAKASAHYLVTKAGEIYQLVKDEDTAWHAGVVKKPNWKLYDGTNPNRYTIGIEHESFDGSLTEDQYQATLWLHKYLNQKHGIPVDTDHIIGHFRINSVDKANCPGPKFPWDRLLRDLKEGSNVEKTAVIFDGKEYDAVIIDGKTYVELRKYTEKLGLKVIYNPQTKKTEVRL